MKCDILLQNKPAIVLIICLHSRHELTEYEGHQQHCSTAVWLGFWSHIRPFTLRTCIQPLGCLIYFSLNYQNISWLLTFITPTSTMDSTMDSTCFHIILFKQLRMSRTSCRVHSASCSYTLKRMFIFWDFARIKLNGSQFSHLQMEPTSQELVTEYPVSSIPGRPEQIARSRPIWKNQDSGTTLCAVSMAQKSSIRLSIIIEWSTP